jgi:hypothetical protein
MKNGPKFKFILKLIALSIFFATCKHDILSPGSGNENGNGGTDSTINSITCSPDTVYFANTVLPVLASNCAKSGCHDSKAHQEGLILDNYTGIMRTVQPGNASRSKLYEVITASGEDIMPPKPNQSLSADDIVSIKTWINQGAKNNQCMGDCDTSVFTYSGAVEPIMNTFCKGCHNPGSLNGGVDLSSYDGVKNVALNGKLVGTVTHSSGYPPMPQGGNQLSDCEIRQIEKWVEAGANNN